MSIAPSPAWHTLTAAEAAARLQTPLPDGLSPAVARARLVEFGPNRLWREKKDPFWEEFLEELREPMVLLLIGAGILYLLWGELAEALTIFAIILTLNTIEVLNEQRAGKAIAALHRLAEPSASVYRGGQVIEMAVDQLVPGDLIALRAGRRVPADARLIESAGLAADESALTGESLPVEKDASALLPEAAPLAERRSMVFSGSLVTRGRGLAVVTATGLHSELGKIAGLARRVKEPRTPLQQAMNELSAALVWVALGFSLGVPLLGVLVAHLPLKDMLLTGLSLAFATIPEEMPIIITLVLALGAYRLSKKQAIVKRLRAVETLGAITVIASDKTGTLTENRMAVTEIEPAAQRARVLEIGVLCNTALESGVQADGSADYSGDPLETALLRAAAQAGLAVRDLRRDSPALAEYSFDNTRKRMAVIVQRDSQPWSMVKGAPEAVLAQAAQIWQGQQPAALSAANRQAILAQAEKLAGQGLRVIAFASRDLAGQALNQTAAESDLVFAGLAGLADPPRAEAAQAIAACRQAGIRPLMITGDHPLTAQSIARQVGLCDGAAGEITLTGSEIDALDEAGLQAALHTVSIFARTTPEHKLRIVQALQASGERVAVTGDGINDAPALAAADIGVAMGETGTDVAREASAMVLADDNFATILTAIAEGRLLFENLKKGVRYYLAVKVALILTSLLPVLLQAPVPFAPVQIILMELFMDLAAAAAFVAERPEADLLRRPARDPRSRFMDGAMITSILLPGIGLFAAVTSAYLLTWNQSHDLRLAQSVAFAAWLVGHVLLAFNLRSERQPLVQLGLFSNRLMLAWACATLTFLAILMLFPALQNLFKTTSLSAAQLGLIALLTFAGTFWLEGVKIILALRAKRNQPESSHWRTI